LHPSLSIVHYRAAALFLEFRLVCPEICEDIISEALLQHDIEKKLLGHHRFALLWRLTGEVGSRSSAQKRPFSRNLFLMLDALDDDQPMVRMAGRTWLADSIHKPER